MGGTLVKNLDGFMGTRVWIIQPLTLTLSRWVCYFSNLCVHEYFFAHLIIIDFLPAGYAGNRYPLYPLLTPPMMNL